MESTELNLFNNIFSKKISDDVMKFITPSYDFWLNFKKNHIFYKGTLKPNTLSTQISWLKDRNFTDSVSKCLTCSDINLFRACLGSDLIQLKVNQIIKCAISISNINIFSPPTYYKRNIHPGKCLVHACTLLKKDCPILIILDSDESVPEFAEYKLETLQDIQNIYKGKLYGYFFKHNNKIDLQFFSKYSNYNKFDDKGWLRDPTINWEKFWNNVTKLTCDGEEIQFKHLESNIDVKMKLDLNPNVLKDIFREDVIVKV